MKSYFHEPPLDNFTGILRLDRRSRNFTHDQLNQYYDRVYKIMIKPVEHKTYTSILSPSQISDYWASVFRVSGVKWVIHIKESFDGGSVFSFNVLKSEISDKSPLHQNGNVE